MSPEWGVHNKLPAPADRGGKNHVSLMVPDAQKALDELHKRAARGLYDKEIAIQTGVNRKRQINLRSRRNPHRVDGSQHHRRPACAVFRRAPAAVLRYGVHSVVEPK